MKNILYSSYLCLFIVGITVISCNNEEVYDVYGETENKVYISNPGNSEFEVIHTPVASVGEVKISMSAYCTHKANGNIKAIFAVDNSLVEEYNLAHGTEYSVVPNEIINLENFDLLISSNTMATEQEVKMSIKEENLILLKEADHYLIPIKLKEVVGNATLSANNNVVYISIGTIEVDDNYRKGVTLDNIHANFIADDIRKGWGAELVGSISFQSNGPEKLFDGVTNLYRQSWQFESKSSPVDLIVDMKEVYDDIIGCRLIGITKGIEVSVSVDKENWIKIGTTTSDKSADIVFYVPIQCRYVKYTFPLVSSGGWWPTTSAGGAIHEFYACTKNK